MVDKTMMGDKCAELVRAAMIGALAVTLGNPTAVYAAEEETADPGQIGIEIAGEAAVGAASFCVEEDAAEEAPAEAEEVTEPEGTQNDEMEEESGSEGKEDETVPEEPEPQEPDGGENAGMTEPGKTGETEPEGPENAEPGEAGETEPEEPENPEPGDQGDMTETPGNSEMDGPWPGEGEDISNDPWPGQEEIGGGDGEQMDRRRKKTDLQEVMMQLVETRRQKSLRILIYHSLRNRQPPRLNPSFRQSRKLSARGKATVSGRRQKLKKSRFPVCRGCFIRLKKHMLSPM
ncbi:MULTISPECIES: hypothetical protein [unclassified Blautia]|uniref:hypothetical protein n=1 Tax=unclassified Blautia TaxID=2648079 RepID=UPI001314DB17|nr:MULTISPECIES: hypothetical protein [unclassified Blautia]